MELKSLYDDPPPKIKTSKGSLRQQYIKKLRKAVHHSTALENLVQIAGDDALRVEAKAYGCWMRGNLSLEKSEWESAVTEYNAAATLYRALAAGGGDNAAEDGTKPKTSDFLEMQDYFVTRADHVIEPLLRYCRYELTETGQMTEEEIQSLLGRDDNRVDDSVYQLRSKLTTLREANLERDAKTQFTNLEFRGFVVPIENQSLRMALLRIDSSSVLTKGNGKSSGEKEFVRLLSAYDDALGVAKRDYKELKELQSGPAVNKKRREVGLLCQYIQYQKLLLLMKRNEDMVNGLRKDGNEKLNLKRLEEIAHLYDALLQDARTISAMTLDPLDDGDELEDEDEFLLEANAQVLRFRALRCYYMGRMYAEKESAEFENARALFGHAMGLSSQAAEELSACQNVSEDLVEAMNALGKEIKGAMVRIQAEEYLRSVTGGLEKGSKRSLLRRLDDYDDGGGMAENYNLVDEEPQLEYVPCKPTFFDIALNHVGEMPEDDLKQWTEQYGKKSSKGGLFGWFRS